MKSINQNIVKKARLSSSLALFTIPFILSSPASCFEFDGTLQGVTITDDQGLNQAPSAVINYTIDNLTATFDATSSDDPDGSISEYRWDFGDGNSAVGAQVSHNYSEGEFPVTLTVIDNEGGAALKQVVIDVAAPVTPAFTLAVNFQPGDVSVPEGYQVDSGASFNSERGFGWTSPPNSWGFRDRDISPDQAYDTMVHVDASTAIWEAEVANGSYSVTVCMGDAAWPGGLQKVQGEGDTIVNNTIDRTNPWVEKTENVMVNDGKLTITFKGSDPSPARLCWIRINAN